MPALAYLMEIRGCPECVCQLPHFSAHTLFYSPVNRHVLSFCISLPDLVVLADVFVCLVEQLLVGMELVLEKCATKFLLDQPFALARMLPIGKPHFFNDIVNVCNDPFHDDMRVPSLGFAE